MPQENLGRPEEVAAIKKWLKELRERAKLTQQDLADSVGVDRKTIGNMEREDSTALPQGFTMLRVLQQLGAVDDAPDVRESPLLARLRSLEEKVDELPTVAEMTDALESLRATIHPEATEHTLETQHETSRGVSGS